MGCTGASAARSRWRTSRLGTSSLLTVSDETSWKRSQLPGDYPPMKDSWGIMNFSCKTCPSTGGEGVYMTTLTIDLPDDVYAVLRRSPLEVQREIRLAAAIDWYRRGLISQERAAQLAGLPRADFLNELAARKIDVHYVDLEELKREIERG